MLCRILKLTPLRSSTPARIRYRSKNIFMTNASPILILIIETEIQKPQETQQY